ncbi:hypothetical protein SAMD00019534_074740 [Acytostelium subglobosum LB1]|uniref:hypothetical protein n=1 Tax=Acytostelium subglobosum LB1 TaxID=1410327 RepID=UPI000644E549|nr:hypothetical protein SAMD00019534_074740 [Acytostelium subglobosum LB1]GAM24299.1 hypothetical protein SAMD00019534_074740 [Acytostelium subglobosum LB1]|eukprot:XP_012752625.1 hypothetical protein SAMD00019534_074740 [Acytostelium subglobosum LB1]
MTLLKSMTSLSFSSSAICNGSVSSGRMNSFGQSSNSTSGIVAQLGQDAGPLIQGTFDTVKAVGNTAITFLDQTVYGLVGL